MKNVNLAEIYFSIGSILMALLSPFVIFACHILHYIWTLPRRFNPKQICGEVAVVTGSGGGLGRCIALELAKNGCHIAVVDVNLSGAEETVQLIKSKFTVKAQAYQVDVTSLRQVEQLNNDVKRDLGLATILVNNAAILLFKNQVNPEPNEIERLIDVNITAHFWTMKVFLENMKAKRKGHLVGISSALGLLPIVYGSAYVCSKFAVRGLMRTLRLDLKMNNLNDIHVATVHPYFIKTNPEVQEFANQVGMNVFYKDLSPELVAERVVEGILYRKEEVFVPCFIGILFRLLDCLPASLQDYILWILMRSYQENVREVHGLTYLEDKMK